MDARAVPAWAEAIAARYGYRAALQRHRRRRPRVRRARPRWRCSRDEAGDPHAAARHSGLRPGGADRRHRLGQVHLRRALVQADRGRLVGLLPRAGRRRRNRSVGDARRLRPGARHRREAAEEPPADRDRRHQCAGRPTASPGSSWRGAGTRCRWPSFSIRASTSASSATSRGPTAISGPACRSA